MPWKWYESKIIKIIDESPTTKRFWVELTDDSQNHSDQNLDPQSALNEMLKVIV